MPIVGNKKFAYTDTGREKAYNYAKETNQPIMEVNEFGNDAPKIPDPSSPMSLDKNRFGRRDNHNKKNMY
tara:strand:+ start:7793 stop:8002 length:210 start_codon:yes stop_codon:yes gene_type:complete